MWSLGKVIHTPEVMRVYIGSFQDDPTAADAFTASLFERETTDLLDDLYALPRTSAVRKINDLLKRCRQIRVHAHIISTLKREMPAVFGKAAKQAELLQNLPAIFTKVQKQTQLPPGDFPDINMYKEILKESDFDKFPKMYPKLLEKLDQVIREDLPMLMRDFPPGPIIKPPTIFNPYTEKSVNPAFESREDKYDDFSGGENASGESLAPVHHQSDHLDASSSIWQWTPPEADHYQKVFYSLQPHDGKISGNQAKGVFSEANLPKSDLADIWQLADAGADGALDLHEFMVMMKLVQVRLQGGTIPGTLPLAMQAKNK